MTAEYDENQPEHIVVEDLARRASVALHAPSRDSVDSSLVLTGRRSDEVHEVYDLERFDPTPRRAQGDAVLHDADAFAAYVNRVGTAATTVWADETGMVVTAVINDHVEGEAGHQGWRDHRVILRLQNEPEWSAWMTWCLGPDARVGSEGPKHAPTATAEFLEQFGDAVTDPGRMELLDIASTIHGTKTSEVIDITDRHSGAVHVMVKETVGAQAGSTGAPVTIPEKITVALPPFLGYSPVPVDILFRFRVQGEGQNARLHVRFDPVRPDLAQRRAFRTIRDQLAGKLTSAPVFLGSAPAPRTVPSGSLRVGEGHR